MLFIHVTGKVEEVNKETSLYQHYLNSPSWKPYKEINETVDSIYNNMTKKELMEVVRKKGLDVSSRLTKNDIIAKLEEADHDTVKLNVEFTDNLIK